MKQHLSNLIDAMVSNTSEEDTNKHFSSYIEEKSIELLGKEPTNKTVTSEEQHNEP